LSAQGLQKAAQFINTLGQLLPVFGEADAEGIDTDKFVMGVLARQLPPDVLATAAPMVAALAAIVADKQPEQAP